jgi:hypothetical protein
MILRVLPALPGLYLQHVRGHQDRKVEYSQLPLLAQLNVDADAMATLYQQQHTQSHARVLLTDTAGVHLVMPHGSITSRYTTELRYQATHGPLLKHIQTKHGWSKHTTNSISWKAHGTALRNWIKERTHFVKLVQGILPTANHVHRHDPIRSLCPVCELQIEDWTHILCCTHDSRSQWRQTFLTTLRTEFNRSQTRPILVQVLMDAITGWLTSTQPDTFALYPTRYSACVHCAISQQNSIGWQQVFLGRLSYEWSDIQDTF